MSTRRSFFAMIGSAAVSGLVAQRAFAAAPTLILPLGLITEATDFAPLERDVPTDWQRLNAFVAAGNSPMDAIIDIKRTMSQDQFPVWLEYGLCTKGYREQPADRALEVRWHERCRHRLPTEAGARVAQARAQTDTFSDRRTVSNASLAGQGLVLGSHYRWAHRRGGPAMTTRRDWLAFFGEAVGKAANLLADGDA